MQEFCCKNCGGELLPHKIEGTLICKNCCSVFTHSEAEKEKAFLQSALDEIKREKLLNLRRRLWEQINRAYTDSEAIISVCREIKTLHAEDFLANFFEVANSGTAQEVNAFLDQINVEENYGSIDAVLNFMIKSLKVENLLSVNNLVERAYKTRNLEKYDELATKVSLEAKKVDNGVYELALPRDVFIAYSSKDMAKVQQLVGVLEGQGLSCFVAMRNLQHGRGAVANYENALKTAMANCQTFVFVSSQNSRSFGCDALKHELKFIRDDDMSKTPFELRQTPYDRIPAKYKKPRVEWRLDDVKNNASVEKYVSEFFYGLEYCYTAQEVADRIGEFALFGFAKDEEVPENTQIQAIKDELEELKRRQTTNVSDDDLIEKMAEAQIIAEKKKAEEAERIRQENEARLKENRRIAEAKRKAEEARLASDFEIKDGVLIKYKGRSEKVVIPNTVTSIGERAFSGCSSLKGIVIPDSVTSIGTKAFSGCVNLSSVIIGNGVASIGDEVFFYCSKIDYTVKDELKYLGNENNPYLYLASTVSKSVTAVTINDNCRLIGSDAFRSCSDLINVTIPEGVIFIGDRAFSNCSKLPKIQIPDSVKEMGSSVFEYCSKLASVTMGKNIVSIKERTFWDCGSLTEMLIPDSVVSIKNFAFWYCDSLNEIVIPNRVKEIGARAFYNCSKLAKIVIPKNVKFIYKDSFRDCKKAVFYCEADKQPDGWEKGWKPSLFTKVRWGTKIEEIK